MKKILIFSCIATMFACGPSTPITPSTQQTTDSILEAKVDSILQEKMEEYYATNGQIIIMDLHKNEVIANVGEGQKHPSFLLNLKALNQALEENKIRITDTVDTEKGVFCYKDQIIRDHNWRSGGYGQIDLKRAIMFNSKIGVIKALDSAGFEIVDSLATPLEILSTYTSVLGNDSLRSAFRSAVTNGLSRKAASENVEVAGLINTNQLNEGAPSDSIIAYMDFCGHFPAEAPQYSIIVSLKKTGTPASGVFSSTLFKEVVDYMTTRQEKEI